MRGRPLRFFFFLAITLLACAVPTVRAEGAGPTTPDCAAARCVPAYWEGGQQAAGFLDAEFRPGETFTPKFTGVLTAVRVGLYTVEYPTSNAIAEIRVTVNGLPTGAVLAQATVLGAPYAAGALHTADFTSQNIVLAGGTRYAVTLRCPTHQYILGTFPGCSANTATGAYCHSYDFGQTWTSAPPGTYPNDRSIIFEVCLDAATAASRTTWGRVKAMYR